MTRFVTFGDGDGYVVARVENYLDPASRRNPTPVSRHGTEEEAVEAMRRRNGDARAER